LTLLKMCIVYFVVLYFIYYFRYDYENVDNSGADKMVDLLNAFIADKTNIGKVLKGGSKEYKVAKAEDFEYHDPIDQSIAKKQVLFIVLIL